MGTWERAIAEHAYEGMAAQGVLADLVPAYYVHRGEALDAVKADGKALKNAWTELQADREVVLAAVQQDGFALVYASPELQAARAATSCKGLSQSRRAPLLSNRSISHVPMNMRQTGLASRR